MKLTKNLNSKGFSHIETLLVVVVVLAIGATGLYVWNHNKANNTAHAATAYSYIGTGKIWTTYPHTSTQFIGFKGWACKEKINGVNYIKAALTTDRKIPSDLQVEGYVASYGSVTKPISINWIQYNYNIWSGDGLYTIGRHSVDYSKTNLIKVWAGGRYGGQATSLAPHASSLTQC